MRDYWSLTGNDRYDIGCTGQTVFLLDKKGTEIAKFKDLIYAYDAAISPRGDIFAVNSSEGILAVYSFSPPALQKKFRYAKADWGGGDSFCFSPDGSDFLHIQPYLSCLRTSLAVYDTGSFTLKSGSCTKTTGLFSTLSNMTGKAAIISCWDFTETRTE